MKVLDIFNESESYVDEGALDYIKGIGRHVGDKFMDKMAEKGRQILEPIEKAHAAGRQASRVGDIRNMTRTQNQLFQQLVDLADKVGPDQIVKMINKMYAQKQINLANKMKKMFLQAAQQRQTPTTEGVLDYLKGAGGAARGAAQGATRTVGQAARQAGGAVKQAGSQIGHAVVGAAGQVGRSAQQAGQAVSGAVKDVHAQGQQASIQADVVNTLQKLGQIMLKLNAIQKQMM